MILWILIPFILLLLCLLFLHIRKSYAICKIRRMTICDKIERLNQVTAPFGFEYKLSQDIFTSRTDAWQRDYGYSAVYDRYASFFQMIFDCEPVYFDYDGSTWLLECWKGQYGITTGCEIGLYKAEGLVPHDQRHRTLFQTVPDDRLPVFSFTLLRNGMPICRRCQKHWWLTAFLMSTFSSPRALTMKISVTFPSEKMCAAFCRGLTEAGYNSSELYISDASVFFTFAKPRTRQPFSRFCCHRSWVQFKNRCLIRLFLKVTKPFCHTLDRLLLLYEYLPFLFRYMLKIRRSSKRQRKCCRQGGCR